MRQNILPKQLYAAISKLKCKETDICMSGEASAPPLPSSPHSSPPPPPSTLSLSLAAMPRIIAQTVLYVKIMIKMQN